MPETNENLKNNEVKEDKLDSLVNGSKKLVIDANSVEWGVNAVNIAMKKSLEEAWFSYLLEDNDGVNNKNVKLYNEFMSVVKDKTIPLRELIGEGNGEYISDEKLDDLMKIFDNVSNEELDDFVQYLRDSKNSREYEDLHCVLSNQKVQDRFFKTWNVFILETLMKIFFDKNNPKIWSWVDDNEKIYYNIRNLVENWQLKSGAIKIDNWDQLVSLDGIDYIYSNWNPNPLSPILNYCVQYEDGVYFWMLNYVDWQVTLVEWWKFVLKNGDILIAWDNWLLNRVEV